MNSVRGQLSADGYIGPIEITNGQHVVSLDVVGTFTGTLVVEYRRPGDADTDYRTLHSVTGEAHDVIDCVGPLVVRAGFAAGGYTSGTADVELSVA